MSSYPYTYGSPVHNVILRERQYKTKLAHVVLLWLHQKICSFLLWIEIVEIVRCGMVFAAR